MRELTAWYQKKISTYDKEEWETMVEQLLVRGIYRRRVMYFTSKMRPYLIDVDLVRGSSFPKAKPTLGMWRVVWFALARLIFMPGLYRWWRQQTSAACARLLLLLWLLQVSNILLYFLAPQSAEIDVNCLIVPLALMVGLSVVHAQIVSTTALELGRVRPRSSYRRKWAHNTRRRKSSGDGGSPGASAESGATSSHSKGSKGTKFRRKQTTQMLTRLNAGQDNVEEDSLRRRKIIYEPDILSSDMDGEVLKKAKIKSKDSDDEDYMEWKKPLPPTVTFTPPPEDINGSHNPFPDKPNSFAEVSSSHEFQPVERHAPRHPFDRLLSEGDDGFESLNGNVSNGSDFESRTADNKVHKPKINVSLHDSCPPSSSKDDSKFKFSNLKKTKCSLNVSINGDDSLKMKSEVGYVSGGSSLNKKYRCDSCNDPCDSLSQKEGDFDKSNKRSDQRRPNVMFQYSWAKEKGNEMPSAKGVNKKMKNHMSCEHSSSSEEECETASAPSLGLPSHHTMSDWVGQTTNSEDCSYSSESDGSHSDLGYKNPTDSAWDPCAILNPASDTVNCTIWEGGYLMKAELSAVDISLYVVARAEHAMMNGGGYIWAGVVMAGIVATISPMFKLIHVAMAWDTRGAEEIQEVSLLTYLPCLIFNYSKGSIFALMWASFGENAWELTINVLAFILKFALAALLFFLLAVAERAFKQRFLYAKLFSHLTSARRARKSELPHFRLNKVRNIKTWLSARSYLRRRGPQRSVDVIVSAAFVITLLLLAYVSAQFLRDAVSLENSVLLEAMTWCCCLGAYLLRLMTLGANVNRKHRACLSALLTEQINLHLAIEQRPENKEQLTVANNVLKLAADLLKELDTPFKISGMCANHYLYTITKVVILSAMSGVLSEILGFKLKLDKIKIK